MLAFVLKRSATSGQRRPSPLACAIDRSVAFIVNAALMASQWQHRARLPCTHTFTLSARMEKSQVQYFFQSLRYDPTGDRARAAYNLWWCVPNQLYQLFRFAINKPNDEKPAISLQNNNCYALNKSRTENEILSLDHIKNVFPQQYAWMELFTELQQSLRNVEKWYAKNNSCTLYLFGRRWSAEWIGPLKFSFIPIIVFRRQMASVSRVTAVSVIETTLGKNIKWRTEPLCVLA